MTAGCRQRVRVPRQNRDRRRSDTRHARRLIERAGANRAKPLHNFPRQAGNARVLLTIYNVLGERVATVFEGVEAAGSHARTWNASGAPAGVYFVELAVREEDAGGIFRHRRKLILMR